MPLRVTVDGEQRFWLQERGGCMTRIIWAGDEVTKSPPVWAPWRCSKGAVVKKSGDTVLQVQCQTQVPLCIPCLSPWALGHSNYWAVPGVGRTGWANLGQLWQHQLGFPLLNWALSWSVGMWWSAENRTIQGKTFLSGRSPACPWVSHRSNSSVQ